MLHYHQPSWEKPDDFRTDLCVYGGTSAGVIAAVVAARRGARVALMAPEQHLGGMTAGGLGMTDIGNKHVIGGTAREFYRLVGRSYGMAEEWRFEPHVAERVFEKMLAEAGVRVCRGQFLDSVNIGGRRIEAVKFETGLVVAASLFIDATYEGDLLARAGVSHAIGREANAMFGETLNGAQVRATHQFDFAVDPWRTPGAPGSGLLPGIEPGDVEIGAGDHRVQAYNFRMCLTQNTASHVPFPKPVRYDESRYELLARYLAAGWNEAFHKFDPIRGGKTDTNNHGAVSTDHIGAGHSWPNAGYAERERIFQDHVAYQQGLMWFLAHHPRVPAAIREPMAAWGLAADEFETTGHWPHQLYVREARRLRGRLVMTEHHCVGRERATDSIGLAAYGMDSHNCRRFVRDGRVWNEGDVQVAGFVPYPISYRAITPRAEECENLLVPVCVSATHIAFGSIRMEPVFMVLGESAAVAATLALKENCAVQDLPYPMLEAELRKAGQVLALDSAMAQRNEIV